MGDLFGILIFFIAIVLSIAQNAREKKKQQQSQDEMSKRIQERKGSSSTDVARTAKPKGSGQGSKPIAPGTSGRDLLEALFGEGAAENDEGWKPVPQPAQRPIQPAKRPDPAVRQATPDTHQSSYAQRESAQLQQARQRASHEKQQQQAERDKARREQHSRQQVIDERQRRKQEREYQRRQEAARAAQQRAPHRAQVPGGTSGFVPRDLDDARRAIVMAEILGPPKAFQD